MDDNRAATTQAESLRIDLLRDADVAFWCRLLDVDHRELRRAVQQVGPRASAVAMYFARKGSAAAADAHGIDGPRLS